MNERKAVIKNADMDNNVQEDAVHIAANAVDNYNVEKDIAAHIKKEFDRKYSPTWHCIVGRHFGRMETSSNLVESSETKALVCHTDMSQSMQDDIITICLKYWNSCQSSLDTPACIKRILDKKYGPAWHCIIGNEYNSCVTHDSQCFLDFKFEKKSFMIYKTTL
ncbi:hypothetical protein MN116_003277 [Schistosoma mekongi]|uniref:Dynein light chain n=1 Tax=Schistosoma mekongi TaxID=38744 RepID=A0AAE1ZH85_SCHME|nr:hypothetical protein MN116_003277 [Schistosoma mekongi]